MESKILAQIDRLHRHHEHAVRTYDYLSLLDLASVLRIWTEIVPVLMKSQEHAQSRYFNTAAPHRKIAQAARGNAFVLSYFPPGMLTFAHNGELFYAKDVNTNDCSLGGIAKLLPNGSMACKQFHFTNWDPDDALMRFFGLPTIRRVSIGGWMEGEVARTQFRDPEKGLIQAQFTRATLIKRLANKYDASHFSGAESDESSNRYDSHVDYMFNFKVGGLPLPYLILLGIAQQIIGYFQTVEPELFP